MTDYNIGPCGCCGKTHVVTITAEYYSVSPYMVMSFTVTLKCSNGSTNVLAPQQDSLPPVYASSSDLPVSLSQSIVDSIESSILSCTGEMVEFPTDITLHYKELNGFRKVFESSWTF